MKIVSININGIRAGERKGFFKWMKQLDADILCFQEIKAQVDQLTADAFWPEGYHCFYHPAEKKGYSGVAILSKKEPTNVVYGTGIESMDFEGRNIRVDFDGVSVMSLYLPSGTNLARLEHKLEYMDLFQDYINTLKKEVPNLIICGDYNICHEAIDIHDPVRNKNISGFLPEERAWMSQFLENGFVDAFREFNLEAHNYSWWSYRANSRTNNKGWRLDYTLVTQSLQEKLKRAVILSEVVHSDHCPVLVELK